MEQIQILNKQCELFVPLLFLYHVYSVKRQLLIYKSAVYLKYLVIILDKFEL